LPEFRCFLAKIGFLRQKRAEFGFLFLAGGLVLVCLETFNFGAVLLFFVFLRRRF